MNKSFFKNLFRNEVAIFSFLKYLTYGAGIIRTLFFSFYLGSYLFGIWSFILMFLQYFSYSNFGVQYFINLFLSKKRTENLANENKFSIVGFQITLITGFFFGIILIAILKLAPHLFSKYNFTDYYFPVLLISISQNINKYFINIHRVYGRLKLIGIYELINIIGIVPFIFIASDNKIITILNIWMLLSISFSFFFGGLLKIQFFTIKLFSLRIYKEILAKGFVLLIYNLTSILLILSLKTYVSYKYSVEDFGYFSLASSLAISSLILLQSFIFAFFPKLINRFSSMKSNAERMLLIKKIQKLYLPLSFTSCFIICALFPIVQSLVPKLENIGTIFTLLIISYTFNAFAVGYDFLLLSNKNEKYLTLSNAIALLTTLSAITVLEITNTKNIYIICSILFLSNTVYIFSILYFSYQKFRLTINKDFLFSYTKYFLLSICIISILFFTHGINQRISILIFLSVYFWSNYRNIRHLITESISMLFNKNIHKF